MGTEFVIDYVPTDSAWAARTTKALENLGHSVFFPERDLSPGDHIAQLRDATEKSHFLILLWSKTAATHAAKHVAWATQAALRLRSAGLDKIRILAERGAKLPLVLADLPTFHDLDDLLVSQSNFGPVLGDSPPATIDYFISHSSRDFACALQLYELSSRLGHAWIAPKNMEGNLPYGTQILRAIENARTLAILLTPASMQSAQCLREVYLAMEARKRIVAFHCGDSQIGEDWRYPLTSVHRVSIDCSKVQEEVVLAALRN